MKEVTFTFMHLADTSIQSDLQYIQVIHFFVCSLGIEPTSFALLTQCSTTEPQEHKLKVINDIMTVKVYLVKHHILRKEVSNKNGERK